MSTDLRAGYKRTEIGVIPEDWEERSIGQLIEFQGGSQPVKSVFSSVEQPGFIRLIQIRDYKSDRFAIFAPIELLRRFCEKHDIMIGRYGPPVFQILRGIDGAYNVALIKACPRPEIDREFAYFFLKQDSLFDFIDKLSRRSSGQTGVDLSELRRYPLPLPQLSEQRAIAEALSDVDALLGGLDRLIAKKRHLKQAAMQKLLTGQTRLPGFSGEWEVKRLGDLGFFLKGSGVRKDESQGGAFPCIRYGEIYTRHNDYIKEFYSSISVEVAANARLLKKGDLLFAGSGETKAEIGKCVAFLGDAEAYAGGDIVILRPQTVNSMFLGFSLNTPSMNKQKASRGQGDAVVHISSIALADINIAMPSLPEQTAIATILTGMDAELDALQARRGKTQALKQAMMQELLTGRIRLV